MRHDRPRRAPILGTGAAVALFRPLLEGRQSEQLCVAHLDAAGGLLDLTYCPLGTDRAIRVPLRGIVRDALEADARAMILAHNHPHGDPRPSDADRQATRRMAELCRELDIRLVDHLIFAGEATASFRELGLL